MEVIESMKIETKVKQGWQVYRESLDPEEVHESLMHDLIAKKLEKCDYIKSIKRVQNYNGTINIIVTYDETLRRVYTVKSY